MPSLGLQHRRCASVDVRDVIVGVFVHSTVRHSLGVLQTHVQAVHRLLPAAVIGHGRHRRPAAARLQVCICRSYTCNVTLQICRRIGFYRKGSNVVQQNKISCCAALSFSLFYFMSFYVAAARAPF